MHAEQEFNELKIESEEYHRHKHDFISWFE